MAEEHKDREEDSKSRDLEIRREYPLAPGAYYGHQEDEIHIRDYLQIILRRKWIVITFFHRCRHDRHSRHLHDETPVQVNDFDQDRQGKPQHPHL